MIVTGLFLWWPSNSKGWGGILYPRIGQGGRTFWKDIHSVTGIYVSSFALFLLLHRFAMGKELGWILKAIRQFSAGRGVSQDWTTSSADLLAARTARSNSAMHDMSHMAGMGSMGGAADMSVSPNAEHTGVWVDTVRCWTARTLSVAITRWLRRWHR